MKKKRVLHLLDNLRKKTEKLAWECFTPGCKENAINSHILQKNGILSSISRDGLLTSLKVSTFNPDMVEFIKVGINKSFSFKGFCNTHDTDIFLDIEQESVDFSKYSNQLLFAYRAILNEKRKKEIIVKWFNSAIHDRVLGREIDTNLFRKFAASNKQGWEDIKHHESLLLEDLNSTDDRKFIFKVRYLPWIPVCTSAVYSAQTTMDQQTRINLTGKDYSEPLDAIFLNFFPTGDKNVLIIGFNKDLHPRHKKKIDEYFEKSIEECLKKISDTLILRCETWVCSIDFFEKELAHRQDEIIRLTRFASENENEDLSLSFNIFDGIEPVAEY